MINRFIWKKEFENDDYIFYRKRKKAKLDQMIIGITRIRNEELIIKDTIEHISKFVDAIVVLDDCSTDNTVKIIQKNEKIVKLIEHKVWNHNRISEETAHRKLLYNSVKEYNPRWIFYFDADERFEISKKELLKIPNDIDGIKIRLFDAYMTKENNGDYKKGMHLYNFRDSFGPEYRDILMIFRNKDYIDFIGDDAREPVGCIKTICDFYCQHYGKAISVVQWEETCDYYSAFFPEPYKKKWKNRKGMAIHEKSDFGNQLLSWDDVKLRGFRL